jgi:exodeoxyribonuclease VII small subunit
MAEKLKTFTQLKAELDEVMEELRRDDADIDSAMKSYERGMELVALLETQLKTAENNITKLKAKFD